MINSINSNLSYYSLQANDRIVSKSAAEKATEEEEASSALSVTSADASSEAAHLTLEDHFGMMQSFGKPPFPPAASEEEDDTDSDTFSPIDSIDTDQDGTISADEYDALMEAMGITDPLSSDEFFAQYDTNSDGEITAEEMEASRPAGPPPLSEEKQAFSSEIDTDGDGSISADEYETLVSRLGIDDAPSSDEFFAEFDTDSDGELTAEEIETAYNNYVNLAASTVGTYETNYDYVYGQSRTDFNASV